MDNIFNDLFDDETPQPPKKALPEEDVVNIDNNVPENIEFEGGGIAELTPEQIAMVLANIDAMEVIQEENKQTIAPHVVDGRVVIDNAEERMTVSQDILKNNFRLNDIALNTKTILANGNPEQLALIEQGRMADNMFRESAENGTLLTAAMRSYGDQDERLFSERDTKEGLELAYALGVLTKEQAEAAMLNIGDTPDLVESVKLPDEIFEGFEQNQEDNINLLDNNPQRLDDVVEPIQDRENILVPGIGHNGGEIVEAKEKDIWTPIRRLPGYVGMGARASQVDIMGQAIRVVGRDIFSKYPCFKDFTDKARAANVDALGEVKVLASYTGVPQEIITRTAIWVEKNGQKVGVVELDFGDMFKNGNNKYRPEILFAMDEKTSYILVKESMQRGGPTNDFYLYSWTGGRNFYGKNPKALKELKDYFNGKTQNMNYLANKKNEIQLPQREAAPNIENEVQRRRLI